MEKLLSIIVPVYNVEPYLRQCLDSLLAQTYTNLEILVVDDGSTDGSGQICDDYADRDSRIKVIHQRNKGLSGARNTALDIAAGDYVMFVDSDDYVMPDYASHMAAALESEAGADIAICRFYHHRMQEDGTYTVQPCISQPEARVLTGRDILSRRFGDMKVYYVLAWNKIFRRSLFDTVRFPEGKTCEDAWTSLDYYQIADKVVCTDELLYCYRIRTGSISQTQSPKWVNTQLEWLRRETDYFLGVNETAVAALPACNYLSMAFKNRKTINAKDYWLTAYQIAMAADLTLKERIKYRLYHAICQKAW